MERLDPRRERPARERHVEADRLAGEGTAVGAQDLLVLLREGADGRAHDLPGLKTQGSQTSPHRRGEAQLLVGGPEYGRQLLDGERVRADFGAALAAEGLRSAPFEPGLDLFAAATGRAEPVTVAELESSQQMRRLMNRYLRQDDDGWSTVMYLYPPQGRWRREPPPAAVQLAEELGPRASLTGFNTVSAFFRSLVLTDARLAALAGIVLVACLLWLDYRRLSYMLISLAPLAVGIVWMLGAMVVFGIAMNFMNIFVSTMIIGIGVDYGVHMIHRHRESRGADVEQRLEGMVETGKAIALAAMSTMIGFGSLSLSHYPGLRSMGLVAILGALTTSLVAITVLPAWLALRLRGKSGQGRQSP